MTRPIIGMTIKPVGVCWSCRQLMSAMHAHMRRHVPAVRMCSCVCACDAWEAELCVLSWDYPTRAGFWRFFYLFIFKSICSAVATVKHKNHLQPRWANIESTTCEWICFDGVIASSVISRLKNKCESYLIRKAEMISHRCLKRAPLGFLIKNS